MPRFPALVVLGISQDAGVPQAGCLRACCRAARRNPSLRRFAAGAAIVGRDRSWLVDVTPDVRPQLEALHRVTRAPLAGAFLTHGHMGHYSGLLHFGREAMNVRSLPAWTMPRMAAFLRSQAPWEMLVRNGNIRLRPLRPEAAVRLEDGIRVTPFLVPHRAEYTETAGFRIRGPRRSALWLPDIDRWETWETRLEDAVADVDAAWIDGTFFSLDELPFRPAAEIPHPPIRDTMERLASLPPRERAKVRFLHLNHTNPVLREGSREARLVRAAGFGIAREGERFAL